MTNKGLTTIFVDKKATKRRLRRAKLLVTDGPDKGKVCSETCSDSASFCSSCGMAA